MPDSQAKKRWNVENTVKIPLKLNIRTDADILAVLDGKAKQTVLKQLIREGLSADTKN